MSHCILFSDSCEQLMTVVMIVSNYDVDLMSSYGEYEAHLREVLRISDVLNSRPVWQHSQILGIYFALSSAYEFVNDTEFV